MQSHKSQTLFFASPPPLALVFIACLLITVFSTSRNVAASCPPSSNRDRGGCKTCATEQMKYGCPKCVPLLRCMARCLWGGRSQSHCMATCGCDVAKPTLSECKRCVSRCKCSCTA